MQTHIKEAETLSYVETNNELLEYVSIPSDIFSKRDHQQGGRKKHAHTCIEMSYVLSGKASHVIRYADGTEEKNTISMGSYYILDHTVSHIILDVSKDFLLVNVLFHPCFINPSFTQYEPFDNIIKYVFTDLHLHTMTDFVLNKNYYDSEKQLHLVFEKAWETYKKREPGYKNLLRCYISEILIQTVKKQISNQKNKNHIVLDIRDYINENYMRDITLTQICNERYLNQSFISRKFKEVIGVPFETYLQNVRIQNACTLLTETNNAVEKIIEQVGYTDGASFRKHFKRILGITPLQFRKLHTS